MDIIDRVVFIRGEIVKHMKIKKIFYKHLSKTLLIKFIEKFIKREIKESNGRLREIEKRWKDVSLVLML